MHKVIIKHETILAMKKAKDRGTKELKVADWVACLRCGWKGEYHVHNCAGPAYLDSYRCSTYNFICDDCIEMLVDPELGPTIAEEVSPTYSGSCGLDCCTTRLAAAAYILLSGRL